LEADILGSADFFGTRSGLSNGGSLTAVYQDVLGRLAFAAEAQAWDPVLVSTKLGATPDARRTAALAILGSPEAEQNALKALYQAFLRRAIDLAHGRTRRGCRPSKRTRR
jgi:hypothetical protein